MSAVLRVVIGGGVLALFGYKAGESLGEEAGKALPWIIGGAAVLYLAARAK